MCFNVSKLGEGGVAKLKLVVDDSANYNPRLDTKLDFNRATQSNEHRRTIRSSSFS